MGEENIVVDLLESAPLHQQWAREKEWIKGLIERGHMLVNRIHNDIKIEYSEPITPDLWEKIKRRAYSPLPKAKDSRLQRASDLAHTLLRKWVDLLTERGYQGGQIQL